MLAIQVVLQLVHFRALYTFMTKGGLQGKGPEWPLGSCKIQPLFYKQFMKLFRRGMWQFIRDHSVIWSDQMIMVMIICG